MIDSVTGLLGATADWLNRETNIKSAVLFGSSAGRDEAASAHDRWSDIDLQIIVSEPRLLESIQWEKALPTEQFSLQIVRPATGGVRKVTALFKRGQIDLVVVPFARVNFARLGMALGLHKRSHRWDVALNEIRTSMQFGYRFIKGEKDWKGFYARIMKDMPGVRMSDSEARATADSFLCDLIWILQKTERGELIAAQHMTHQGLAQSLFKLMRELHQRRGQSLKSFGLARHFEVSLSPDELKWVQIRTALDAKAIRQAAWHAHASLVAIMQIMVPDWRTPSSLSEVLAEFAEK